MEKNFCNLMEEALEIESKKLEFTDRFRDLEEWDSLSQLSLIAMLDEEFQVEIESDDFANLFTIQELIDEVNKRKS